MRDFQPLGGRPFLDFHMQDCLLDKNVRKGKQFPSKKLCKSTRGYGNYLSQSFWSQENMTFFFQYLNRFECQTAVVFSILHPLLNSRFKVMFQSIANPELQQYLS